MVVVLQTGNAPHNAVDADSDTPSSAAFPPPAVANVIRF